MFAVLILFSLLWLIISLSFSNKEKSPIRQSYDPPNREIAALDNIVPNSPIEPYDIKHIVQLVEPPHLAHTTCDV